MKHVYIIQHTHFDAEVFLTREETLPWGFSNIFDMLRVFETDSDFKFTLDQVCYVEPFLERYPECKKLFMKHLRSGRLEIAGGMYAMADTNQPSGEALTRQFLRGIRYCSDELGVDINVGWTLDTFGHSPQVPQILSRSGIKYHVFTRCADVKHSEFLWEALDGSETLCHWMPLHYGGIGIGHCQEHFDELVMERAAVLSKWAVGDCLAILDGADLCSPNPVMNERIRQFNKKYDGEIKLYNAVPSEFFAHVERFRPQLERFKADFNPCFQAGYSSRIEMKQATRESEDSLYTAEVINAVLGAGTGRSEFGRLWDPVLFNQFHDGMCGVATDKVFNVMMERHRVSTLLAGDITSRALAKLAMEVNVSWANDISGAIPFLVFNPLAWERRESVTVKAAFPPNGAWGANIRDSKGDNHPCELSAIQRYPDGAIRECDITFIAPLPSLGYATFCVIPRDTYIAKEPSGAGPHYGMHELNTAYMKNEYFDIQVDFFTGAIKSLVRTKTKTEYICREKPWAATIAREPDAGDFWELNAPLRGAVNTPEQRSRDVFSIADVLYSKDSGGVCGFHDGEIKQVFHIERGFGSGKFKYDITLYKGLERIDIDGEIINNEEDVRYRALFPLSFKKGNYKIRRSVPFGHISQPEGEYPALDYTDISDNDKGMCVLNVGIPGNAVHDGTLTLSLLNATSFKGYSGSGFSEDSPAKGGFEKGKAIGFKYSLLPHEGYSPSVFARMARERCVKPLVIKCPHGAGKLPPVVSFVSVDSPNVNISAYMSTSPGCGQTESVVMRLCETAGSKNKVVITLENSFATAKDVSIAEYPLPERGDLLLNGGGRTLELEIKPYEIRTVKLSL